MDLKLLDISSLLLVLCFFLLLRSRSSKLKLPPGSWKLPIIGSIHHLLASLPHHAFRRLSQQHGSVMLVRLGQINTLVISSPEAASEIMKTQDLNFCSRPDTYNTRNLFYGCRDIAFAPYTDHWRQLRKIATIELMSAKRVRESKLVNISGMLATLTNTIIHRCAFGNKSDPKIAIKLISAFQELLKLLSGFCVVDLFPQIKHLDLLIGTRYKVRKLHRHIDEILAIIIKEHKRKHVSPTAVEEVEDLLDVLLSIRDQGKHEISLTDDDLKAVILDMFLAGAETISTVITWGMSELMKHPEIMAKAKSEVRQVLIGKTKIQESDLGQLHYLKLVIKETLRLHPAAPLLIRRGCLETCQVAGYHVPGGTRVSINAWAIGRDPRYWENAEHFIPERFSNNPIDFKGTHFEYLPFGAGRRMCPGITFASSAVEFTLAHLLLNFDWKLPNGMTPEQLDMSEFFGLSAPRKFDLCLLATPYLIE